MEQLSTGASLPSIQDYVRRMEIERGLDGQDITAQCLKLGEEVGELYRPREGSPQRGPRLDLAATMKPVGTETTRLVVLRGNSASGKSSVASGIRSRYGRGLAVIGQDNLRRVVLREHDTPGAANIGLIGLTARYALDHGFHVIIEGILYASHYGEMLTGLVADHQGTTRLYYMDVPFEETLRRHATKPEATEYGEAEMRAWYRDLDLLPGVTEKIIPAQASLDDTIAAIISEAGLTCQLGELAG